MKRAARNWPPKHQLLTFFPIKKTLSPSQKGGKRVGLVYLNCRGLEGGEQRVRVDIWDLIQKGGQKSAAKTSTAHLFPPLKDALPKSKGWETRGTSLFELLWVGRGGTEGWNWHLGLNSKGRPEIGRQNINCSPFSPIKRRSRTDTSPTSTREGLFDPCGG